MGVTPLREASDVAMRSLAAPMSGAFDLLRSGRLRPREADPRVGWQIVNLDLDGRRLRYRVTDNVDAHGSLGGPATTTWAMSLHGYFAGGSMYARESEILAGRFGWRVVNPSLPGFGGSDPFAWADISMDHLSDQISLIKEHLGIGTMVLLGHSMGAAVAMHYAARHPDDVLGVIYRDGVATPAWQRRHGAVARLLAGTLPDVAPVADMVAAVALDLPDLLAGHVLTTIRSMIPDLRHNVRTFARSAPVASMLMSLDLSEDVRKVCTLGIPMLAEWGCFDRLIPPSTATEFAEVADMEVHWLPGGHSWMLARPSAQADVLTRMRWGREFLEEVATRVGGLAAASPT
jgi:pimeloyl-ACP methyl ester carboxylesterase